MTVMPVDPAAVTYMNPYMAGGHEGFDFGATSGARFFSIGHLTRRLFGAMLQRIWALPVPAG